MPRTSLETLTRRVTEYFRRRALQYGLVADKVEARYILNWGGFVNASFTVTDGQSFYHLKLADDEGVQEDLQRWKLFARRLSERYHAPGMLDWIDLPRTPFAGPLFEYIPGQAADFAGQPELLRGVLDLLASLHADLVLAQVLESLEGPAPSCTEYFMSVYIDRFDEDLRVVAVNLPPFVSLDLLDWMMGETRELEGLARELPAFAAPAGSPTHGDLWPNNVLVTASGQWYVIDWDDLALGDPALEYSIVLGPLWRNGALSEAEVYRLLPDAEDLRERFRLCLRAYILDEIIDTLADWVESEFAPEHQAEVRAEKERQHRAALALYREMY